ncbi:hypothetical protein [Arthrobacter sp. AD-310]
MTAVAEPFDSSMVSLPEADVIPLQPPAAAAPALLGALSLAPDVEADSLRDVTLASARLERLQWEMDAVEEELCAALRQASSRSVSASALARAAGIPLPELETYLQRPALGAGAAMSPFSITGF